MERKEIPSTYKWNLELIYKRSDEVENDIKEVKKLTKKFTTYKNSILKSSSNLYEATVLYFDIIRILDKLIVYANMKFHEDMSVSHNQALVGKIDKLTDNLTSDIAFFIPELLTADYKKIDKYIKDDSRLKPYEFNFKDVFRDKEHTLEANAEEMMAKLGGVFNASSNTYDMLDTVDLTFEEVIDKNGNKLPLNQSNFSVYLRSNDRELRKSAFTNYYKSYFNHKNTFASTLSGSINAGFFISNIRKYNNPLEMALFKDDISEKLYEKLLNEVNEGLNISHKYIQLRKKVLNLDEMHMYDIYAPLVKTNEKKYSYEEAISLIKKALAPLGKQYIDDLTKLIDSRCIDVLHNDNKKGGAYSWGSYDTLPYVLLNFEGTFNDVSTIAHELGHSMHSYYSKKNNSYWDFQYSIFLAEIASTVNEILLNKYCSEHATSKEEKLFYLNNLLEMLRTTFIRQTMFAEFEKGLYDKHENGETLTEEVISNYYYLLNKKYYGNDIISDEEIKLEWCRISHFYTSFYVYQYATGIAIASKIVDDILDSKKGSLDNYLKLLTTGGSDYSLNLLKIVGIDILNDDTIDKAKLLFEETINEFSKNM